MSATQLSLDLWEVELAYQGKSTKHWKNVATIEGTEREAERQAVALYNQDPAAVDLLVVPAEARERARG
jgi:hypothetical protein